MIKYYSKRLLRIVVTGPMTNLITKKVHWSILSLKRNGPFCLF